MPSITIVIPAYNRSRVLERAVRSVQAQTVSDWELLIVDDGSTDETPIVAERLADRDGRVRVLRHPVNRGAQAARNTGARAARSKWVAFLDSDDEWLPSSLELRLGLAEQRGVSVVHSEGLVVRGDDVPVAFRVPPITGRSYGRLLAGPGPLLQALLVTKGALERIGFLDEAIVAFQEWDTSIRLARYFDFGFVPEATFVYDCRATDTISADPVRSARGYEQVVRKHALEMLRVHGPRTLSRHYSAAAGWYRRAGLIASARRCSLLAAVIWPIRLGARLKNALAAIP